MRIIAGLCLLAATTIASLAQGPPELVIHDLGSGMFDIQVADLNGGTAWVSAGLYGLTSHGAAFRYGRDPNGLINLTQAFGDRNVTLLSMPSAQNSNRRFNGTRAVRFSGGYEGPDGYGGAVDTFPNHFSATIFRHFSDPHADVGYFARIALDVSATGFTANQIFAVQGDAPENATVLAHGVVTSTTDAWFDIEQAQINWTVYAIPEPGTSALLACGLLPFLRRRD